MNEFRKYLTPRESSFLVITAIVGMFLNNYAGRIIVKLLPHDFTLAVTEFILQIAGHLLFASFMAISLYISIMIPRSYGFSGTRIAVLAFIFLFPIVSTVMEYRIVSNLNNVVSAIDSDVLMLKQMTEKKMAKATKKESISKLSYLNAKNLYEFEGKIITFLDVDGSKHKYEPDQESIKSRETRIFFLESTKFKNKAMAAEIAINVLFTLIAIYLGFTRKTTERSIT